MVLVGTRGPPGQCWARLGENITWGNDESLYEKKSCETFYCIVLIVTGENKNDDINI